MTEATSTSSSIEPISGRELETTSAMRFGLPSKGRLQSKTAEFLAAAGIELVKSRVDREYAGELVGVDGVELVFLQAGEIPQKLASGEIHLGVTGEDMVRERVGNWSHQISLIKPLEFGHADLIVAVPKCWIDVTTTDDLDDVAADIRERHGHPLRVATKYKRLARKFFRERGVANYRLIDSQGATEGTVAAGSAEAIVDITSSGETLRANHLKILDDGLILKSQAFLCASKKAKWPQSAMSSLRSLLDRLGGVTQKPGPVALRVRIDRENLDRSEAALARTGATLVQRPLQGFPGQASLTAPADQLGFVIDVLTAAGATSVETETPQGAAAGANKKNSLFDDFMRELERPA